ncbi:MAG: hypothetical protein RL637_218 [Pseudomonadota bacterium]|jgi:D-alanyl-D-alanine carboxypeptidase (penicillin-binding protein 5/6)
MVKYMGFSAGSQPRMLPILVSWILSMMLITAQVSAAIFPEQPNLDASSYLLEDFNSGQILAQKNADIRLPPASLTKIMTAYVVYRELASKHFTVNDLVTISAKAWQTGGSKMFVEAGKQVRMEDLIKGMIIQSGNDASVALAEYVGGTEDNFIKMMNQHAARLGMTNTHFENSMGLPVDNHYTTARDLVILTRALISEFPEYYRWDSQKEFTYNKITQQNRNKLLWRDNSVDGVKTGFTDAAGYCMVASAKRNDMRLISVVMGTKSPDARANESQALLNYGFQFYETNRLYPARKILKTAKVWSGNGQALQLGLAEDLYVTILRRHQPELTAQISVNPHINAPVFQGKNYGALTVSFAGAVLVNRPLIGLNNVNSGNFFQRLYDKITLMME